MNCLQKSLHYSFLDKTFPIVLPCWDLGGMLNLRDSSSYQIFFIETADYLNEHSQEISPMNI